MSTEVIETKYDRVNTIRVKDPGVKGDPSRCAIARVIRKWNPHLTYVKVGKKTIGATDKAREVRYTWVTPLSVRAAIQKHDKDGVAEFPEFELRTSEAAVAPIYGTTSPEKVKAEKARDSAYRGAVASGTRSPKRLTAAQRRKHQRMRRNG